MPSISCVFCAHDNPVGAKYCNECAAPLTLKPCPNCEAVNDRLAVRCYKCGRECTAAVASAETAQEEAECTLAVDAPIFPPPVSPSCTSTSKMLVGVPFASDRSVSTLVNPVDFFERSPGAVTKQLFAEPRKHQETPAAVIPRRSARHDITLRVGLLMIVTMGCAALGYFTYRFPSAADARGSSTETTNHAADTATVRATMVETSSDGSTGMGVLAEPLPSSSSSVDVNAKLAADRQPAEAEDSKSPESAVSTDAAAEVAAAHSKVSSMRSVSAGIAVPRPKAPSRASKQPLHPSGVAMPSATPRSSGDTTDAARYAVTPPLRRGRDDPQLGPTGICTREIAALALCSVRADPEGT